MLTIASRIDIVNRLGRAIAESTLSRLFVSLLDHPDYPAQLARALGLTRSNISNQLSCLRGCVIVVALAKGRKTRYEIADPHLTHALSALVDVVLAVNESAECLDASCSVPQDKGDNERYSMRRTPDFYKEGSAIG